MEAWPIEEAFVVRPLASLLFAALLPVVLDAAPRRALSDPGARDRARAATRSVGLGLAFLVGSTALGPPLAEAEGGIASHAAGFLCASAFALVDARWVGAPRFRALAAGFTLALVVGGVAAEALAPWGIFVTAAAVVAAGAAGYRPRTPTGPDAAIGWVTGLGVAAGLAALVALPVPMTEIVPDDAPTYGDATWRLRVDPWDEQAMLANAWESRRRDELDTSLAQAREAARMGLLDGPRLELEAELHAARGDCEAAQRTFDRAIRARAAEAFDVDEIIEPLVLGGYQLPPTLLTRCGGLEHRPGLMPL